MRTHLAIALVLIAVGSAQAAEKRFDRTFTVTPGGTLRVEADGATVHVTGSDSNQVVVHMVANGSEDNLAQTNLDAVQSGSEVTVTMKRSKSSWFSWGSGNNNEDIRVTVPRQFVVKVQTSGGDVELRDTAGVASLRSSGGDITATKVTGNVDIRTSGGSIHVEDVRGDVDANTSGGDVRMLNVDGRMKGHSSGGSLRYSLVGANRGISATTSGGDIELRLPRTTKGNLEANTSGGSVSTDIPVTSTDRDENHLEGTLNGGGETIYARTSGGSISVRATN